MPENGPTVLDLNVRKENNMLTLEIYKYMDTVYLKKYILNFIDIQYNEYYYCSTLRHYTDKLH